MRIQWIEMIMHGADKSAEKDPENLPEKFNLKILKAVQVAPHLNASPTEKDGSGITPMQLGISPSGTVVRGWTPSRTRESRSWWSSTYIYDDDVAAVRPVPDAAAQEPEAETTLAIGFVDITAELMAIGGGWSLSLLDTLSLTLTGCCCCFPVAALSRTVLRTLGCQTVRLPRCGRSSMHAVALPLHIIDVIRGSLGFKRNREEQRLQ